MARTEECILYRNFDNGEVLDIMTSLMNSYEAGEEGFENRKEEFFHIAGSLVEMAGMYGFSGNLWHTYLTQLLVNHENAFSTASEIRGVVEGSINHLALHDFGIFKELYDFDLAVFDSAFGTDCADFLCNYVNTGCNSKVYNQRICDRICDMSKTLAEASTVEEFMADMVQFYKDFGVGKLGLNKAFRIEHGKDGKPVITPITRIAHVNLDDLVGYEIPKQKLIENTEAFVRGRKANNCLLFGDAGTGKSSSVKAILNEYYGQGLRMIEVYKHQFKALSEVLEQIKDRNYKFIIYMDDLSFEEYELEYKYLKAILEGGLGKRPKNVLIYATSNRRHLIRETWSDRSDMSQDELHRSDTMQEKLSLVARFGVTIGYYRPSQQEYFDIVLQLAKRYPEITLSEEELKLKANQWELSHGGISGRTAQQFINHLAGMPADD